MTPKRRISIPKDLLELAPAYLESRKHDLTDLKDALTRKDFAFIENLSHKTKGTAAGYGFLDLGTIAKSLEIAAKEERFDEVTQNFLAMREYLESVEIQE